MQKLRDLVTVRLGTHAAAQYENMENYETYLSTNALVKYNSRIMVDSGSKQGYNDQFVL